MERLQPAILSLALILVGAASIRWWTTAQPGVVVSLREPTESDGTASGQKPLAPTEHCNRLVTGFRSGTGTPADSTSRWPRFRGELGTGVAAAPVELFDEWPAGGPERAWEIDLGEGHAGAAVFDGSIYILDYDEELRADSLRCLSLVDGAEIWRRWYEVRIKRNHGVSRTVPAVTKDFVVTIGPKCHVMCVKRENGDYVWGIDLVREHGSTVPLWYTAQCPLIDNGAVVLAPAGRMLLMAVDCATGEILWETPNPDGWTMSHSSIVSMQFAGRKAYVYSAIGGIVAVAAEEPDRGKILWKTNAWLHNVVAPSPVQLSETRIFVTSGHGAGSMLLSLVSGTDGAFTLSNAREIDKTVIACEQQTPIWHGNRLYAVLPKDAGSKREQLVCFDGALKEIWASGKDHRFGLGPYIACGDRMFVLGDRGVLALLDLSGRQYRELARAQVLNGRDAWAPLALADGWLLARDSKKMVCLRVGKKRTEQEDGW